MHCPTASILVDLRASQQSRFRPTPTTLTEHLCSRLRCRGCPGSTRARNQVLPASSPPRRHRSGPGGRTAHQKGPGTTLARRPSRPFAGLGTDGPTVGSGHIEPDSRHAIRGRSSAGNHDGFFASRRAGLIRKRSECEGRRSSTGVSRGRLERTHPAGELAQLGLEGLCLLSGARPLMLRSVCSSDDEAACRPSSSITTA